MEASTRCAFALCVPWIERESKKVAKVDQQLAEARDGKLKEQLAAQLQTVRATRDAMIDKKLAEQEKIQREFDGYKETKLIQEALKKAKNEKARGGMKELFSIKPAAGGASAADGASSLEAVNQKLRRWPIRRRPSSLPARPVLCSLSLQGRSQRRQMIRWRWIRRLRSVLLILLISELLSGPRVPPPLGRTDE